MPDCRLDDRAIDRDLRREGNGLMPEGYGTVDHVVPPVGAWQPRPRVVERPAAHSLCNREASDGTGSTDFTL